MTTCMYVHKLFCIYTHMRYWEDQHSRGLTEVVGGDGINYKPIDTHLLPFYTRLLQKCSRWGAKLEMKNKNKITSQPLLVSAESVTFYHEFLLFIIPCCLD